MNTIPSKIIHAYLLDWKSFIEQNRYTHNYVTLLKWLATIYSNMDKSQEDFHVETSIYFSPGYARYTCYRYSIYVFDILLDLITGTIIDGDPSIKALW